MTSYSDRTDVDRRRERSATNLTLAGGFLVLSGVVSVVQGVIALANDTYFTVARQSIFQSNPTQWGWVQLGGGLVVLVTGIAVLRRTPWARPVALTLASISMVASFLFFPGRVFGSMIVIAVDAIIIGILLAPGAFDRED
jgi:hypothetical protein